MSRLDNKTPTHDFERLLQYIINSRHTVFKTVNTALIDLYWQVGKTLSEKIEKERWGKGIIQQLAGYIKVNAPEIKGFSDKNLWRMRQFYEAYHGDEKLSTLVRELSWSHNLAIFSRCKDSREREYYLNQTLNDRYTVRELNRQISSSLYERAQLSDTKLSTALRELPDSTKALFKDHYVLEFLGLPDMHS